MNVPELIVRSTLKKLVKQELDVKNPDGIRVEIDRQLNRVTLGALFIQDGKPQTKITTKELSESQFAELLGERMGESQKAAIVVKGKTVTCYTYDKNLVPTQINL